MPRRSERCSAIERAGALGPPRGALSHRRGRRRLPRGRGGVPVRVGRIFGVSADVFDAIEARHLEGRRGDPWAVLGLPRDADLAAARARWRELVRAHHPDMMIARGLPPETVNLGNARLAQINRAWEELSARFAAAPGTAAGAPAE